MKKHAFLILAHDNPKILSFLLKQLDDERNDIYILFDKKTSLEDKDFKLNKTNLFFVPRIDVRWGHYSLTEAPIRLIDYAIKQNEYKYYHFLGGTNLCSKTQEEIHQFYDNTNLEYFHINVGNFRSIQNRCKYYYPFITMKKFRKSKLIKGISTFLGKMQFLVGINRLKHSTLYPLYNGMNWFSITDDFARYLLSKEKLIYKTFNHTLASDEVFMQSVAMHSSFRDRVYGYNGKEDFIDASKTYQFWNNGKSTYIDTLEKMNIIKNDSHSFFARKFKDEDIDIINQCLGDTISNEK